MIDADDMVNVPRSVGTKEFVSCATNSRLTTEVVVVVVSVSRHVRESFKRRWTLAYFLPELVCNA